jgi:ATP-dependent RNA helicase RhlE
MTTTFEGLGLAAPLLKALTSEGYVTPTPIQVQAIPHVMQGRDVQGIAQTGTGKTAAFALPILHRLIANKIQPKPRSCRVLVLSPTRELASQIVESFRSYGRNVGLRTALVFGGVPKGRQVKTMQGGVDVLVATPGRLLDLMHDGAIQLGSVEVLVLDEADHMLDLGFIVPIRKIVCTIPTQRQTLFFSATMPKEISSLAGAMLKDPVHVAVTPVATTAERVEQKVIFVETARKRQVLADILKRGDMARTLVFTRTKHGADRVTQHLEAIGMPAAAIHGNKSQPQRERALQNFKDGRIKVLVATDIAARGIDVDGVTHVVNFDLPNVPEAYVHRIGRTARAGHTGIAISFCDSSERAFLRGIEKLTRTRLAVEEPERLAA